MRGLSYIIYIIAGGLVFLATGCVQDLGPMILDYGKARSPEMEAFVMQAAKESGVKLDSFRCSDPQFYAWDDVPLHELPDHERAEKEFRRAMYFGAEVVFQERHWNVSYKRFDDVWMLDNVSTVISDPDTQILYTSCGGTEDRIGVIKSHPVFRHFVPQTHRRARRAHDELKRRIRDVPPPSFAHFTDR